MTDYKCKHPGCNRIFKNKGKLLNHMRWDHPDKKTSSDEHVIYDAIQDEIKLLKSERELRMLRTLGGSDADKDDGKIAANIDGQSVKLTSSEYMHWRQQERDREDKKLEREDKLEKKETDIINELRKQNVDLQQSMFNFQSQILQAQMSHSPMDQFLETKQKLEELGVGSQKSGLEKMYQMEADKLKTMLSVFTDTTKSVRTRMDMGLELLKPLAEDYAKQSVLSMKQQRGEGSGKEVPHTEAEMEDALKKLNETEKSSGATEGPPSDANSPEESKPEPVDKKVVTIDKKKKPGGE